ncbi:MAG: YedE-related selenium metabolism membrane protein, partial [Firmicutes bacterium]|nr:YedE-related selenium metabolism membrane protein [Bacillota bacterium]
VGLVGFIGGILLGVVFLKKGFTLGRGYKQGKAEAAAFPVVYFLLFALFHLSEEGPGSMRAPIIASLIAGLAVGVFCQRSRMCMVGGVRNAVMFKDFGLIAGFIVVILTVLVGNLILGKFNPGFADQPIAHSDGLWNFLGTALMGWGSVLLGGCPLRQLILTGQGESDSAVTVLGMLVGAAFCHNFGLASSAAGPTAGGKIAVIVGFAVVAVISLLYTGKGETA